MNNPVQSTGHRTEQLAGSSAERQAGSSTEQRVIDSLCQWLGDGESAWLCTIVSTWGSSPRPAGSILAFHPDYGIVGSLSGGCIEEALIRKLSSASQENETDVAPYLYQYAITDDDRTQYSLPCGGQLTVLVEHLVPTAETIQHVRIICNVLNNRQSVRRQVSLKGEGANIITEPGAVAGPAVMTSPDYVATRFGPTFKMLLLGAGEVSYHVAKIAGTVDFSVTLCDPRPTFLQGWQCEGVEVIQCLPDDLVKARFSDPYCAILALAHDPRVDDMALMEALKTNAFYIGAMGSLKTTKDRLNRLAELDCSSSEIEKLHAPVGVNIGSKTPAEIAISIMAQVIAERHRFLNGDRNKLAADVE
ncbi:XdhC family protein [Alkalimarinus coralli]|uniref:XdhC family protein n=1 Tax=Alkalimarinus coralli TaxID=2935863 RepID=UPI00202B2E96|nr:XdhC family protein [Alkalimarinus coralli]